MKSVLEPLASSLIASTSATSSSAWLSVHLVHTLAAIGIIVVLQIAALAYVTMRLTAVERQHLELKAQTQTLLQSATARQPVETSVLNTLVGQHADRIASRLRAEMALRQTVPGESAIDGQSFSPKFALRTNSAPLSGTEVGDPEKLMVAVRDIIGTQVPLLPAESDALIITSTEIEGQLMEARLSLSDMSRIASDLNQQVSLRTSTIGKQIELVTVRHRRSQDGSPNLALHIPRSILSAL